MGPAWALASLALALGRHGGDSHHLRRGYGPRPSERQREGVILHDPAERSVCVWRSLAPPQNEAQREHTPMCKNPTRDDTVHADRRASTRNAAHRLKRGGGTYGGRLCRMVDQYNPAAARDQEGTNGGV